MSGVGIHGGNRICHGRVVPLDFRVISDTHDEEITICKCEMTNNSIRYQLAQTEKDNGSGYVHIQAKTQSSNTDITGPNWRRNKYVRYNEPAYVCGFKLRTVNKISSPSTEDVEISVWFSNKKIPSSVSDNKIPFAADYRVGHIRTELNLIP